MPGLDLTQVQSLTVQYQETARMLPFLMLEDMVREQNIRVIPDVQNVDREQTVQRKAGLLKPYNQANVIHDSEVGKVIERELVARTVYYSLEDNIQNYKDKKVITAAALDNKKKEHPLQDTIIEEIIRSFAEDLRTAFWTAEYDVADTSPTGAFDGIHKQINDAITAGEISAANGNLVTTGAIPATDSTTGEVIPGKAIDQLVDFVKVAHPVLRRNAILYMSYAVYFAAIDAFEYKTQYKDVDVSAIEKYINAKAKSNVRVVVVDEFAGDRIILVSGDPRDPLLDLGLNTSDTTFVEVNRLSKDRNIISFWIQATAGTRVRGFHRKVFQVNDRTATAGLTMGDY